MRKARKGGWRAILPSMGDAAPTIDESSPQTNGRIVIYRESRNFRAFRRVYRAEFTMLRCVSSFQPC